MKRGRILPFCSQPFPGVRSRFAVAANALRSPQQLAETKKENVSFYAATGSRGLLCSTAPRALFEVALPTTE
jgi:hypothetical protein